EVHGGRLRWPGGPRRGDPPCGSGGGSEGRRRGRRGGRAPGASRASRRGRAGDAMLHDRHRTLVRGGRQGIHVVERAGFGDLGHDTLEGRRHPYIASPARAARRRKIQGRGHFFRPRADIHVPVPMPESNPLTTGAEDVRWNLADLYADEAALQADTALAEAEAEAFADAYRGRLADLDAAGLAAALATLAGIHDRIGRAYTYVYLHWSTATEDPARGALLQKVREAYTRTGQHLIFFDVEWAALEDEEADALLAAPELAPYRHYLELKRKAKEHLLSEPEEKILAEKAVTGWSAWNRFFDETLGAARFDVRGERLPLQQVMAKLHEPDRALRRDAHVAITEGLAPLLRPLAFVFNTILADKASSDRLRRYEGWLDARNESNEIRAESVEALIEAVTTRYDLVHRFYALKRRLLGLDELFDYDRYAPLAETSEIVSWDRAKAMVLDGYGAFQPEYGDIAQRFFDGGWID